MAASYTGGTSLAQSLGTDVVYLLMSRPTAPLCYCLQHWAGIHGKQSHNIHQYRVTVLSGCSSETKEKAFTTLVRPVLEYAGAVWDPYQANHISQLDSVQRKAARFVHADYSRYSSITRMMDNLGWRTLQERRFVSRMSLFYRVAHHQTACIIPPYIATTQPRTRTSHNLQYIPPQAPTDVYKFSFFPRCVRTWNTLPSTIVKADSVDTFKAALNNSFRAGNMYMVPPRDTQQRPRLGSTGCIAALGPMY